MTKPMVSPGSMLNTSEGLVATGGLTALTTALTNDADWRVQAAAAVGIALLSATYIFARSRVKTCAVEEVLEDE